MLGDDLIKVLGMGIGPVWKKELGFHEEKRLEMEPFFE